MNRAAPSLAELSGHDLGSRVATIDDRDAILYAVAVGARADQLDLVFERDLRVLPTLACGLGLWAVESAGDLGAYDRTESLHVGQTLEIHEPLTPGSFEMSARIGDVWDKGRATVVEVIVSASAFAAGYTIFLPGIGDWGGERGPSTPRPDRIEPTFESSVPTSAQAAVLYRLTGDRHPVHVDPEVSAALGFERPILHGLATLGMAALVVAESVDAHPADLRSLDARLSRPVLPGQELRVSAEPAAHRGCAFEVSVADELALAGRAAFAR